LPIASPTTATPGRLLPWREKHNVLNVESLLGRAPVGLANVAPRCRRDLDRSREAQNRGVDSDRCCELREPAERLVRQPQCARRALVEIKHDERCRKADTGNTSVDPQPIAVHHACYVTDIRHQSNAFADAATGCRPVSVYVAADKTCGTGRIHAS
jgi:hypothetical protein